LQVSSLIFLVLTQEYPSLRNAQRYIGYLMRMGFSQDRIRIVVNRYNRKTNSSHATLEQIQQTLNQPVFYGIPDSPAILGAINKARPLVSSRESAPEVDKAFRSFVDKAAGSRKAAAQAGNGE
jgi:pilus assembly protein CpaE